MGSRLENLIRSAVQTFATKPNGSFVNSNTTVNLMVLRQLLSEISPLEDLGLTRNPGQPRFPSQIFSSRTAPVSYMEIFENRCVSIGVFTLKEGSCIPLHDHVGMYGILKVLYGNLNIQSYTPIDQVTSQSITTGAQSQQFIRAQRFPTSLLSEGDAPAVLSPSDQNIHTLWTSGGSASFLDILAPPYDPDGRQSGVVRDCYYYTDVGTEDGVQVNSEIRLLKQIPCPASFWCDSLKYQGPDIEHLYQELY